jgi:nucleotide-binding universal stress UspA family protein
LDQAGEDMGMSAPKILFPTNFSPSARARFEEAVSSAKTRHATLLVLHVEKSQTATDWAIGRERLEPSIELVERMLQEFNPRDPIVPVLYRFAIGDPAAEILRVADEEQVELIVMGTRRRGRWPALPTSSVVKAVIRRAKCPVTSYRDLMRVPVSVRRENRELNSRRQPA